MLPSSDDIFTLGLSLKSLCKTGSGTLCSWKFRKEVWTQRAKSESAAWALLTVWEGMILLDPGVEMNQQSQHEGLSRDPNNSHYPQRELLGNKHQ